MIDPALRTRIRALFFAEHWKVGTIAEQLGVHHDAVRAAINVDAMLSERTRQCRSMLDPFKGFVAETLAQYPALRATRVFEMLQLRGYQGGVRIVRDLVSATRKRSRHEAFLRRETFPGEEAQVDWGAFGNIRVGDATHPLMCFVMVLGWSRAIFARFYLGARMECFLDGHVAAFAALGGAPRRILYDNLKSAVLERVGDHVRFHPALLELAGHYHFLPKPCAPYRGNEKGKVERSIRYLRDSFFAARSWRDRGDLNAQLADWITRVSDARAVPGDRSGLTVRDARAREREHLVPLPEHPFAAEVVVPIASGKTPYLRFERNHYSIPHTLVRQPLSLVASIDAVRVLHGDDEIARHARSYDAGRYVEDPEHLRDLRDRKRHAHNLRGRDRVRAVCPAAEDFFRTLAERGETLARPAVRLGQLLDRYGAAALEKALREALARGAVAAESVAYLLQEGHRDAPPATTVAVPLPENSRARIAVAPHALEAYDRLTARDDAEVSRG